MFYNENWSEDTKLKVWAKAQKDSANDASILEKRYCRCLDELW